MAAVGIVMVGSESGPLTHWDEKTTSGGEPARGEFHGGW